MGKIIYFDLCALMVIGVLLMASILRKMTHGRQNKLYIMVLSISFISVVADIFAIQLDAMGVGHTIEKYAAHTIYLFFHNLMTPFYVVFLSSLTDAWHRLTGRRDVHVAYAAPLAVVGLLLVVNFFQPIMFYFDSNGDYVRGPWFLLLYVTAALYMALGLYHLIRYRKRFTLLQFVAVMVMFPLLFMAVAIQLFFPAAIVEMFACALSFLCVSMMIQRPEETLDADTGLRNRNAYASDMRKAMMNKKSLQILLIQIENYKVLHDMLGFEIMQKLIANTALEVLKLNRSMKVKPEAYSLGNGLLAVAFSLKDFEKVESYADTINKALKPSYPMNGMDVHLQAKLCLVRWPEDIGDVNQLLSFEQELKDLSYTGELIYVSTLREDRNFDIKRNIDGIIERGFAEHNFEVYYQPIFSINEGRFHSAEALLRLKDSVYGFVSPDIFITAAEKNGSIHKIGQFVLEEVCRFIASDEFKRIGLKYIEINLSVAQCLRTNLAKEILETIEKYNIGVDQINLEITETAASVAQDMLIDNLNELTAAGIRFSLDDFGTGYSNMQRVASLPFELVKLDKSFADAADDARMQIVIENTVQMIKDMKMKIVVEGIENEKMVHFFSRLECEYIQGYYYSKPIPRREFVNFLIENSGQVVYN